MGRGGLDGTVHSGAAFCIMKAPIPRNGTFRTNTQTETTRGYASGTPGTSFARKAGPHPRLCGGAAQDLRSQSCNARKALEAAEKERRRQKALARKRARAEAAKLRAAKAKAAEKAAKAEEKTREKAKAKAAEASKEKTQA